jgi:phospholipid/cholesterol/gamma-HCH transport system substrate-binding protein
LSVENQSALKSALADLATVARTLAARKDTIDAGLRNGARTLENTAQATAQMGAVVDRIGRSADAVQKMGFEVAKAGASAGTTLDAFGADARRFSVETLPELERLLSELSTLSSSLRRLTEQTTRDPRGLLFGHQPATPGPGEKGATP